MFLFLSCRRKEEAKVTTQNCWRGNYIIEQIEVVLDVVVQVWQVGAHFKALVKLESVVPLVLPCIFLRPKRRLLHIVNALRNRRVVGDVFFSAP